MSSKHVAENRPPRGGVISPTLFSVMINDMYVHLPAGMGRSLFADDGAIWKRGMNAEHIDRKVQDGIQQVEKWGIMQYK